MNYPNYDSNVVEWYQTKLIGWTYHKFKSPFDIHIIDDVRILLEALQCGRCCWVRMTKSNLNLHRNEMNKRREAGETVGNQDSRGQTKVSKDHVRKHPGLVKALEMTRPCPQRSRRR